MSPLHAEFSTWRAAHHAAARAELRLYYRQRNLDESPSQAEISEAHALRAKASALLRIFLEQTRLRAVSLR